MKFIDYMQTHKTICSGHDGAFARLATRSHSAPINSDDLDAWAQWLKGYAGRSDALADGLLCCWYQYHDFEREQIVDRCPMCGTIPRYHVTDVWYAGRRSARVWICELHGQYTIVERKGCPTLESIGDLAKIAIHFGTVRQIY